MDIQMMASTKSLIVLKAHSQAKMAPDSLCSSFGPKARVSLQAKGKERAIKL